MVKHIVMWKVKEDTPHGTKQEVAEKIKIALEGLKGEVESLVDIEVGINFEVSDMAYDVVLYSVFEDKEGLEAYQKHPAHLKVANELVRPVSAKRVVVDYIV